MAFPDEKAAAIDVLKAYNCDVASIADNLLVDLSKLPRTFIYLIPYFECAPNVLTAFLDCFTDAELTSVKIYYNKSDTSVSDAVIVANSAYDEVIFTVSAGNVLPEVAIIGTSVIGKVTINNTDSTSIYAGVLDVSAGALVKVLDVVDGATLKSLYISGCNGKVSTVNVATDTSNIENVNSFGGGYFGGYNCINAEALCGLDVTSLAVNKLTANSLLLNWVTPAESVRTIVNYRLSNTDTWLYPQSENKNGVSGNYATDGSIGFAFRGLEMDTYYDFKVTNVCNNGILSAGVVITQKTNGIASSGGGGGGGDLLWVGKLQFLSTSGQLDYTPTELPNPLIGANGVDVTVEGVDKYQDVLGSPTDDRNFQLDNVNGKIIFNSELGDSQQVMVKIYR